MMPRIVLTVLILAIIPTGSVWAKSETKMPYFVGAGTCASCHDGAGMGHQMSQWLATKHARAYAILARPESMQIATLSGIPSEPQESPMCLGCHATGAEAEDWEKDPTFHTEDGVQCEKCHGPGSEYMDSEVMKNRPAAMAAGLRIPTIDDCVNCHVVKGSHAAIRKQEAFDLEKAYAKVAHPLPDNSVCDVPLPLPKPAEMDRPHYIGSVACAKCHNQPDMGYQYSQWRISPHSRAYAVLATPKAFEIAKTKGVKGEPQHSPECLECHVGFWRDPSGGVDDPVAIYEGVGCETCHGAGSQFAKEAIMEDPSAARAAGLKSVDSKTCLQCHQDSHDKPFDYKAYKAKIAHPMAPPPRVIEPIYKNPINMALSPDGKELLVTCESSDSVIVIDVTARRKVAEIPVGRQPHDVTFHPNGKTAYVTSRLEDSVSVMDVGGRHVIATLPVGDEPHGILTDAEGKNLYILNTSSDSISVFNTVSLKEV
ncbi:MAG: beta-propeller fold lactonase family protein, partial [Phycisphaerae bacterium]|nr:beta-propeller fold lactonase family protein [Phycisphaerae bacterium]